MDSGEGIKLKLKGEICLWFPMPPYTQAKLLDWQVLDTINPGDVVLDVRLSEVAMVVGVA